MRACRGMGDIRGSKKPVKKAKGGVAAKRHPPKGVQGRPNKKSK